MCKPFSCIAHKSLGILHPTTLTEHSHSAIIDKHGLTDNALKNRQWVKLEVTPEDGNLLSKVSGSTWTLRVDESGTLPKWWNGRTGTRLQDEAFKAVKAWQKKIKAAKKKEDSGTSSPALKAAEKELAKAIALEDKIQAKMDALNDKLAHLENDLYDAQDAQVGARNDADNADEQDKEVTYFLEISTL